MVEEQMDRTTYKRTVWFIRCYNEFQEEYKQIIDETSERNGIRGTGISNPTAIKVEKRDRVKKNIDMIEKGLQVVPTKYRKGVLLYVINHSPFPCNASEKTYRRWEKRFIYAVAVNKGWI